MSTVIRDRPYSEQFFREFYANLEPEINDPTRLKHHQIYVSGEFLNFHQVLLIVFM